MKETLKLALEALTYIYTETTADEDELIDQAITALRLAIDVQNMASESTYKAALTQPAQEPDYAYPTIEEYEEITGFKVNDTFRMGWVMARTTNDLFKQMEKNT